VRRLETLPGSYEYFYAAVRAALVDQVAPPVATTDALKVLDVIEAAQRSASEGVIVRIGN